MYIQFICTGGIANLHLTFQTDTDKMPKEKANKILDFIKQADFFNLNTNNMDGSMTNGADAFSYQLRIEDGSKKKSFSFTDVTAPQVVRPLLDYLRNLAIEEKMGE